MLRSPQENQSGGHYRNPAPCTKEASREQLCSIPQSPQGKTRGWSLLTNRLQQRCEHVRFILMMPCVEPNSAQSAGTQIVCQKVHKRALAAAPASIHGDRQRKRGVAVSKKAGKAAHDRAKIHEILVTGLQGPVSHPKIGNAFDGSGVLRKKYGQRKKETDKS